MITDTSDASAFSINASGPLAMSGIQLRLPVSYLADPDGGSSLDVSKNIFQVQPEQFL